MRSSGDRTFGRGEGQCQLQDHCRRQRRAVAGHHRVRRLVPHTTILAFLETIALGATGLFAGAALYINLVEHPVRRGLGPSAALQQFAPSYRRAAVMQVLLAGIGGLGGIAVSFVNDVMFWAVAGALILSVIPFTFVAIFPTNHQLLDHQNPPNAEQAQRLLTRWGWLHGVRTAMSLVAFVIMVAGILLN